ncbi:MAG TPA: AraC family transcriptional regulator [Terriglobia bacterium]|nr:AraC family transcriptional regulator [Terriglobia bacterium]
MKPQLQPQLTVRAIRPLVSGLRALGHDPSPILSAVQITEALLNDPEARVPMSTGVHLLSVAAEKTADSNIGLHLAQHAELGSFDIFFYIMVSSPTLGAGYARLSQYQKLINDSTAVDLTTKGEHATLRHRMPGGLAAPRQSAEFILAAWVRAGRVATNMDWAPVEVRFAHQQPPDALDHARFFRAPIRFSTGENTLVCAAALLDTPGARSDPALLTVLDRYAANLLAEAPAGSTFADRARAALVEEMRGGEPRASKVAARLKMSVRSLNRHLAGEGTTYRELLDQLRKELAARHLGDARVSIAEVAFLLGFSELSAFYRAFHRWTGQTPAEFRQSARLKPN